MHQLDCQSGDQRSLPGGLGDHGVARSQRRGGQTGEDGEREIPGRNGRDYAAAMQSQLVLLPGRARKRKRPGELAPGFGCVETQEIDRLADFKDSVG